MNQLEIFQNKEFGEIRTVTINEEPWFVGKDIAGVLGYERPTKAISDHIDEEDRDEIPIQDSIGRMQNTPIINESGLYSLILSSKLPSAKKFKHWVTGEVLPSIRKTGSYTKPMTQMELLELQFKAIQEVDGKITNIDIRMDKLEYDIPVYGIESDEISNHVKRKGVSVLGGKQSESYQNKYIRIQVYTDIYSQFKREFGLYTEEGRPKSYKALKRRYIADAHEFIDCYTPSTFLSDLIRNTNCQMRMEM